VDIAALQALAAAPAAGVQNPQAQAARVFDQIFVELLMEAARPAWAGEQAGAFGTDPWAGMSAALSVALAKTGGLGLGAALLDTGESHKSLGNLEKHGG
jgi:hypothetical protein